jgi:hypothetical protein
LSSTRVEEFGAAYSYIAKDSNVDSSGFGIVCVGIATNVGGDCMVGIEGWIG